MKYAKIDYGVKGNHIESFLFPVEYFTAPCPSGGCNTPGGYEKPGSPKVDGLSPKRGKVKATVVPPEPPVTKVMPTPYQFVDFGKLYTASDTVDDQEDPINSPESSVSSPQIPDSSRKSWRPPTDEDMDCWLHKWWTLKAGYKGTLEDFKKIMFADGLIDSGRVTSTGVKLKIENSDMWYTIKNRARKQVEYYLEQELDFGDIPEPYCFVEKSLTDEEAAAAYEKDKAANPVGFLIGSSEPSAAEEEYGSKDTDSPPQNCEPSWQFRKCKNSDLKANKCNKKKGPEREQCKIDAEGCIADREKYCIKRTGWDAFSSFMRDWNNVKTYYLLVVLVVPLVTLLFPPAVIITSPLALFSGAIIPWVAYKHFYRLFGPGSTIFESLPYFIRWYFWYPVILLASKPTKLFKIWGKAVKKFFTKTVPKAVGKFFSKQIPKLVGKIMEPIMKLVSTVWDTITDSTKPIVKSVMSFVKLIIKAAETVGNVFAKAWGGLMKIVNGVDGILNSVDKAIKSILKAFKKLDKLDKMIGKITKNLFR